MNLLVIRHAPAEDKIPDKKGSERALSPEGRKLFQKICQSLSSLNWTFDLLLDSLLLRSQQTADIFCEYFPPKQRERSQNLQPLSDPSDLFLELQAYNKNSVAVVGHQPFLSKLLYQALPTDNQTESLFLERGAMALLEFSDQVIEKGAVLKKIYLPESF